MSSAIVAWTLVTTISLLFPIAIPTLCGDSPPTILRHPVSQRTLTGDRVLFEVGASSPDFGPLQYQWRRNGHPIPGATKPSLTLQHVQLEEAGDYQVSASNAHGSYLSDVAELRLLNPSLEPGALDQTFHAGPITGEEIESILPLPDGAVLVGGKFSHVQGTPKAFLARLLADGSRDLQFQANEVGPNGTVRTMVIDGHGQVLIGGDFTTYNGGASNGLARIDPKTGALDDAFQAQASTNGSPRALLVLPSEKILVGGLFTQVNRVDVSYIARLLPDGSLDPDFEINQGFRSRIAALAIAPDGSIFVGGRFAAHPGFPYNHLAKLHSNGALDRTFFEDGGPSAEVTGLAVQSNGRVVVAGSFRSAQGRARAGLARFEPDGALDLSFPDQRPDLSLTQVHVDRDDRILVTGAFSQIGGANRPGVARFRADGTLDPEFIPVTLINAEVNTAALQADGRWLLGGEFDRPHPLLLRVQGDPPALGFPTKPLVPKQRIHAKTGCRLCLSVNALSYPAARYTWRFNGMILPGETGPELRLSPFRTTDAGTYQITTENLFGAAQQITLQVDPETHQPFAPNHSDFFSADTPVVIPNVIGSSGESTITITENFEVAQLALSLAIEHDDVNELQAELFAPGASDPVLIFRRPGNNRSGAHLDDTVFDDDAPETIEEGIAPFLGSYRVEDDRGLRQLAGRASEGVWRLRVKDLTHGRAGGALLRWSLRLTAPAHPVSYDHWAANYLPSDLPLRAFREDVNGDGIQNGVAYAFDQNPTTLHILPAPFRDPFGSLVWTHRRWVDPSDIGYDYQISSDLQHWEPLALDDAIRHRTSDRAEEVILRWRSDAPARFLRVTVSPR